MAGGAPTATRISAAATNPTIAGLPLLEATSTAEPVTGPCCAVVPPPDCPGPVVLAFEPLGLVAFPVLAELPEFGVAPGADAFPFTTTQSSGSPAF